MSSALSAAIYKRLAGTEELTGDFLAAQQRLAELVKPDPDTQLPAVQDGNSSDIVVYPCITFRPSPGTIDKRFTRGTVAVDYPIYDLEVWGCARNGLEQVRRRDVSDIGECVDLLLDQRFGAPLLPLTRGSILCAKALMTFTTFYDNKRHAWWGLTRYHFTERRL